MVQFFVLFALNGRFQSDKTVDILGPKELGPEVVLGADAAEVGP